MTPFLNSLIDISKLTSASYMCQTQSRTGLSFNCQFWFCPCHLNNLSPDLLSKLLTIIYHTTHDTLASHGYPTEFSNSVHWHWIYQLATHASSSCFFHLRRKKNPISQARNPGVILDSFSCSHQVLLILLHGYLSSLLPSPLSWLPSSGSNFSFCIIATATVLLVSSPDPPNSFTTLHPESFF